MSSFAPTDKRLQTIHARMPEFPLEPMRLVRMTHHLQKILRDKINAALKPHELVDTSYMVLAVLYGSTDETASASELGEACHEKPANLTRVCDDLEAQGLIARGAKPGDRRSVMISLTEPRPRRHRAGAAVRVRQGRRGVPGLHRRRNAATGRHVRATFA
jgi:MarR family transcriptional repressor of emrRAB